MNKQTANKIYDILVEECGANDNPNASLGRSHFVSMQTCGDQLEEYRFQGDLGFGGKFWNGWRSWSVSCYPEDETPERLQMIEKANQRLEQLWKETHQDG